MKRIAVLTLLFLASAAFSQSKPKDPVPVIGTEQQNAILKLQSHQKDLVIQSRAMQSQFETQMKSFQDQYNTLQKQIDEEQKKATAACGKGFHADIEALKCVADAPVKQEAKPPNKN